MVTPDLEWIVLGVTGRTAAVVRELVRHLEGQPRLLDLLHRLLTDLDSTLCPLIPPPSAAAAPPAPVGPETGPQAPWGDRWDDVPY